MQPLNAPGQIPAKQPDHWLDTVVVVLVVLGGLAVGVWLVYIMMTGKQTALKPMAIFSSVILLVVKILWPLVYGQSAPLTRKWKTLGGDLAFSAIAYDVTMYVGQAKVAALASLNVQDYAPFYLGLGLLTLLSWMLWFYPKTGATDPTDEQVRFCNFLGILIYFGHIYLYLVG